MKATLTYTLPDERHEFELASRADIIGIRNSEFYEFLRSKRKHADLNESQVELLEEVWVEYFGSLGKFLEL